MKDDHITERIIFSAISVTGKLASKRIKIGRRLASRIAPSEIGSPTKIRILEIP